MKFAGTFAVGVAGLALISSLFSQSARPSARKTTPKPDVLLITIDTLPRGSCRRVRIQERRDSDH